MLQLLIYTCRLESNSYNFKVLYVTVLHVGFTFKIKHL